MTDTRAAPRGPLQWESSPTTAETDADECSSLQHRLEEKRAECAQLQEQLEQARAEKAAAHEAGLAGISAAKAHMAQLRAELVSVRKWKDARTGNNDEAEADVDVEALDAEEARKAHMREKQLQVRALRHEVARWKHQV